MKPTHFDTKEYLKKNLPGEVCDKLNKDCGISGLGMRRKPTTHLQYCQVCGDPMEKGETQVIIATGGAAGFFGQTNYFHLDCFRKGLIEMGIIGPNLYEHRKDTFLRSEKNMKSIVEAGIINESKPYDG